MTGIGLQVALIVVGAFAAAGLLLWSARTIRYRVTPTHLKVSWMGVPVRRIRLDDIKRIGNRPVFWAERWPSTLFDAGRMLVIRRRTGWFRHFVITPRFPFEFRNSLEQARRQVPGLAPPPAGPSAGQGKDLPPDGAKNAA